MMGGALSGGESSTPVKAELDPGSMISLLLVRGDLNLNADCTVTYRQGNNLYACGHQVLSVGPAQFPFAPSHVLVTVPSIASSFKLDAPGQVVGTIRQDRFDAIYGVVGEKNPPMIPVTVVDPKHTEYPGGLQVRGCPGAVPLATAGESRRHFDPEQHGTNDRCIHIGS